MNNIDIYDREILRYLLRSGELVTVNKLAKMLKFSWNTVKIHLEKLKKIGLVYWKSKLERKYWMVRRYNSIK